MTGARTLLLPLEGADPLPVRVLPESAAEPSLEGVVAFASEQEVRQLTDAQLADRIRSGRMPVQAYDPDQNRWIDLGPRAVPGTAWIRSVRLPLGQHNRGSVNVFIVDTADGVFLVDAGLASELSRLMDALRIGGVRSGDILGVICTHLHADHIGGASGLRRNGWLAPAAPILMGADTARLGAAMFVGEAPAYLGQLHRNGVRAEELPRWRDDLRTMTELADWPAGVTVVHDGERIDFGAVGIEVIATPGHSPDHIAIRATRNGTSVVFLGDMTLGQRMPRCGVRDWERDDPVSDMRASWRKVGAIGASELGLPAHGAPIAEIGQFARQLDATIEASVGEFRRLHAGTDVTAADLMATLAGPADDWGTRMFAFYDSLAMLKHLVRRGRAVLVSQNPDTYGVEPL